MKDGAGYFSEYIFFWKRQHVDCKEYYIKDFGDQKPGY